MQLQVNVAHAAAESRFQTERNETLSTALTSSRSEVQEERTRKMELQSQYVKLQKVLAERDAAILSLEEEVTDARGAVATLRAEKEALLATEARLTRQFAVQEEDRVRQARLLDSLRDLESGLKAQESEQRKHLEV